MVESGFGYFGALTALEETLSRITGRSVDVIAEPIRKPEMQRRVAKDRINAF